jgi:hypothetical protein
VPYELPSLKVPSVLAVPLALRRRLIGARELIVDSAPILALTHTACIVVGLAAKPAGRHDLIRSRHSRARLHVGGLLNDDMLSRNLSEQQYFFQPML